MIRSPVRLATSLLGLPALLLAATPEDLPPVPDWTVTVDATLAAGYRDNLLLSPTNPDRSAFIRAGIETLALKVPGGNFDGWAFLDIGETRFLTGRETDHERSAIAAGEARWQPTPSFRGTWALQAYHHDQVLDVSVTETDLSTAQLQITGFTTGPVARWIISRCWLEARTAFRRDSYRDDLDGYDDREGTFAAGHAWGQDTELRVALTERRRDHDSRQQFTVSGRPIAGSRLATRQTEAQVDWIQAPVAVKALRLAATLGRQWSRDNGSGYFDYDRDTARLRVTWKADRWEHEFNAEANRYRFPVQFIGLGINPDFRRKDELLLSWETTWRISDRLAALLHVEREQSRSNDDRSRFTVHTAGLGLRWSWDGLAAAIAES